MGTVLSAIFFFLFGFTITSFVEWFIHKEFMHTKKYMETPFIRHAVEHHAERKAPGRYYAKSDELKEYIIFETSFMPVAWIMHLPLYFILYPWFGLNNCIACSLGVATYIACYEFVHWFVHCPEDFPWRNAWLFQFLLEHHRIHHHKANLNYNVALPLADWAMGTLATQSHIKREPEDNRLGTPLPYQQQHTDDNPSL